LDVKNPIAIGTMVPPEYFMEVRYLAHRKQFDVIDVIDCVGKKFAEKFGRQSGGLIHEYNTVGADTIIVTMGSIAGTLKDSIDQLNAEGKEKFGVLSIVSYRPFPSKAIRSALCKATKIIVLEKAVTPGIGGILAQEVELAVKDTGIRVDSVIAGLGGRAITLQQLKDYLTGKLQHQHSHHQHHQNLRNHEIFLSLSNDVVNREYEQRCVKVNNCCSK
jgi:pyruvate ferredoxin oxidoreductase alpha subunit